MKKNIKNTVVLRMGNWSLFLGFFLLTSFIAKGETFTTKRNGSYVQHQIWTPFYPGNIIKENDTIVIGHKIEQNIDLVVKGTVIIEETGSLNGNKNIIIVRSGTLFNLGISRFGFLTNRGAIYNQQSLEVSLDFVNSGNVINHKSISVGNTLDNTGIINGKEGKISANRKLVNSRTGAITGYMDVCSNNFMNVEGGTIDTEKTTFCGNPIFNNNGLLSKQNDALHFEKSASIVSIRTGEYTPF